MISCIVSEHMLGVLMRAHKESPQQVTIFFPTGYDFGTNKRCCVRTFTVEFAFANDTSTKNSQYILQSKTEKMVCFAFRREQTLLSP